MKAAMPRSVMPPMLFALAFEPNHMFASRWLTVQSVVCFKQGVVVTEDIDALFFNHVHPKKVSSFFLVTMSTTILPA